MDYIIAHWQELTSLVIVAVTVLLLIRAIVIERKHKRDCSGCTLVEIRGRQKYTLPKH